MRPIADTVRPVPQGALALCLLLAVSAWSPGSAEEPAAELLVAELEAEAERPGGRLVVALRAEPTSFNPLTAVDRPARAVLSALHADLIHIDRQAQRPVAALARSWASSADGRRYTLHLRRGLRFSDGEEADADDVVFSFEAYLDSAVNSPQRSLLTPGGRPIVIQKIDRWTVAFDLPAPYAAAERLFDSFAILPEHKLASAARDGKLAEAWGGATDPAAVAGLGPFRLREVRPGQRIVLERNPYYWKVDRKGRRLPYLDEVVVLFVGDEETELLRLRAGEIDLVEGLSAESFRLLAEQGREDLRLLDLGPGLEHHFLFFNLNDLGGQGPPALLRRQAWFRDLRFRRAVSTAIDREAIVRLVYGGRATPLGTPVSPGNHRWAHPGLTPPARSLERSRGMLREAGFSWRSDGSLVDGSGERVELSLLTNAGNRQREATAAIVQEDLRQLGFGVSVAALEFRSLLDRIFSSRDYDSCLLGLASGDADPNPEIDVWTSTGSNQLWRLQETAAPEPWQAEVDRLLAAQVGLLDDGERRKAFHRVQELLAENLPVVPLVSPHILVAAKADLANLRAGILPPYSLWNAEELFWREGSR